MSKKIPKNEYSLPKSFWVIVIVIALIACSTSIGLAYWRTGWPGYLQALNKCQGKPPIQASSFITSTYIKPGDKSYRIPGDYTATYYCSETEAQAAGYKHTNS